jgi:parallel beta-helix repeat protein
MTISASRWRLSEKQRAWLVLASVAIIVVISVPCTITRITTRHDRQAEHGIEHCSIRPSADAPIDVDGDAALAAVADRGLGTLASPFVIENRSIALGTAGSAIFIRNTGAWINICNCTITDAGTGINLYNASHVRLSGNTVSLSNAGMFLNQSMNCNISGNVVSDNQFGIVLHRSNFTKIMDNVVRNNTEGIQLALSSSNEVVSNEAMENENSGISMLFGAANVTISSNNFHHNRQGIILASCDNNYISKNTVVYNTGVAIGLITSDYNTVTSNTVSWNGGYGIELNGGNYNKVIGNTIGFNGDECIRDGGFNTLLQDNVCGLVTQPEFPGWILIIVAFGLVSAIAILYIFKRGRDSSRRTW